MSKRKIDFATNFAATMYSVLMLLLFWQYLRFGFLGLGKIYAVFSLIGLLLVLMCCVSFFLLANKKENTGINWLVSGLFLNGTLTYVFLLLWKLSYLFFYTSFGQITDVRLSGMFLLNAIVVYSMSYLMICYGIYDILKKGTSGPVPEKGGDSGDKI